MAIFSSKKKVVESDPAEEKYSAAAISSKIAVLARIATEILHNANEETVKLQLIFPFLKAFGWDVSDPSVGGLEVQAGGVNRADIMLTQNHAVKVVIEAKRQGVKLDDHYEQLMSYFMNCHAAVGVLTNGVEYVFYAYDGDTEWMDFYPFARININTLDMKEKDSFLMHFRRCSFNVERLIDFAQTDNVRTALGGGELDVRDHNTRAAFQKAFPSRTPQELDELIIFANRHYYQ